MGDNTEEENIYDEHIKNNEYRDIVKRGEGAFAIVFEAKKEGKLYAIKCEKPVFVTDKEKIKAIKEKKRTEKKNFDEIIKGGFEHPNIVCHFLYFFGSLPRFNNQEVSFIVMELCKCSLEKWFKDNPRNREYQICFKMFNGIANGLKHIHDNKIIHRDLKPGNILISNDGICKIADFGFSKNNFDDYTFTHRYGTPPYAAPELNDTNAYDYRVDIYALGYIFMEFFSQFNDNKELEKALKKVRKQTLPENFFNRNPDCNNIEIAKALVLKMTEKNPNNRPSIEEIILKCHHLSISKRKQSQDGQQPNVVVGLTGTRNEIRTSNLKVTGDNIVVSQGHQPPMNQSYSVTGVSGSENKFVGGNIEVTGRKITYK